MIMANQSNFTNDTLTNAPAWVTFSAELSAWYKAMICISTAGCGVLIANLHILVLLQCAINQPLLFIPLYQTSFNGPPSGTLCRWTVLSHGVVGNVIDWAEMMIGLNRFIAICFPFSYRRWTTTRIRTAMVVFPWLPGSLLEICFFFGIGGVFRSIPPWGGCGFVPVHPVWAQGKVGISVAFPMTCLGFIYLVICVVIIVRIWSENKQVSTELTLTEATKIRQKQKVFARRYRSVKMLFVSYIWYMICLLPAPLGSTLFADAFRSLPFLSLLLRALLQLGYTTMPIIYFALNMEYRQQFHRLVFQHFGRPDKGSNNVEPSAVSGGGFATNTRNVID